MKMNWNDLVKSRMKEIGVTQYDLAEKMGIAQGTVARYLNKKREPSIDDIGKMMGIVGLESIILTPDGMIDYPDSVIANVSKIDIQPSYQNNFPVISAVQAGQWTEACEPYNVDEIDEWHETTVRTSERCFWLRVQGDSMTSPVGTSIPEGMLVLIDTERDHDNGSLVVAKLTDVNEATFKKFVRDSGQEYLKPLNPNYPMMPINDNCRIIGVAVDAKLKLI
ncbi:LexA family transcriptional regulator [Vibrio alginolyticus]|nr:LexA family transcriptional regulator [Vibrio alginolyticus]